MIDPVTPRVAEAHTIPLEEIVNATAEKHGVPRETLHNLAYSESRWDPTADNGYDRGLFQINRTHHPEVTDECAFDPKCSAEWTAKRVSEGYLYEWVAGNCYSFVSVVLGRKLPLMREIVPNTTPAVGRVAIFKYSNGLKHIGVVKELTSDGFVIREANFEPGLIGERKVLWGDPFLIGFWI